jgi:hypothetical protein
MICPECKAEYRPGFTRCSDCDVELVHSLPQTDEAFSQAIPSGPLVPLWEGEDLALHTTLLKELESAGIHYFDQAMGVLPGARRWDPSPIQPMTRFGYQVAVLSSDLPSAEKILEKLLDEKPKDMNLPMDDEQKAEAPERIAHQHEEPVCEVWAGSNEKLLGFLADALRENEIPVRMGEDVTETKVYVCRADEARAREIVREIVEGAPPE